MQGQEPESSGDAAEVVDSASAAMGAELIVGLDPGGELSGLLPTNQEAAPVAPELARLAERLSEIAGIGLRAERLASGGNVVLTVDSQALSADLATRLAEAGGVTGVYRLERIVPPDGVAPLEFVLDLRAGASFPLTTDIADVPVEAIQPIGESRRVLVVVERRRLLGSAMERLQASPEVLFAQVNWMLRAD
ncbi:hypothetical protein [Arhodomonas sp. SL1]|uniref:hypothetical protein n=1 Tax=Arhodomonas sp. SL1 TaxID=3425691 RepID=UPI003F882564